MWQSSDVTFFVISVPAELKNKQQRNVFIDTNHKPDSSTVGYVSYLATQYTCAEIL